MLTLNQIVRLKRRYRMLRGKQLGVVKGVRHDLIKLDIGDDVIWVKTRDVEEVII